MELEGDRSVIADVVTTVVRVGVLLLPTVVGVNTIGFVVDLPIHKISEHNHAMTFTYTISECGYAHKNHLVHQWILAALKYRYMYL